MQVEQQIHYADPVNYQYLVHDDHDIDKNDVRLVHVTMMLITLHVTMMIIRVHS